MQSTHKLLQQAAQEAVLEAHQRSKVEYQRVLCEGCYLGLQQCVACQGEGWESEGGVERCRVETCTKFIHQACSTDGVCNAHKCSTCQEALKVGDKNLAQCLVCDKTYHFNCKIHVEGIKDKIAEGQARLSSLQKSQISAIERR